MAINKAKAKQPEKDKASASASTEASNSSAAATSTGRLPSLREMQEQKLKERRDKLESAKNKVMEQRKLKQEREAKRKAEMQAKQRRSMVTFVIGLFVMLTALIALYPSTPMIIFSSLLMFSFFFLGVAYQRMVMQLLVVALACVVITGAFYSIMSSMQLILQKNTPLMMVKRY